MTRLFSKRSGSSRSQAAHGYRSSKVGQNFNQRSRFSWRWWLLALVTCAAVLGGSYAWTTNNASLKTALDNSAVASQSAPPLSLGEALDRSIGNFRQQVTSQEQEILMALGNLPQAFVGKLVRDQRLASGEKVVALTFDDGPAPRYTDQVLDILKQEDVKATFFVIGRMFQAFPTIGQRVAREGHVLANHTWSHGYHRHAPAAAAREIDQTAAIIQAKTGQVARLYRPPGGVLNNGMDTYAQGRGYATILWGTDTGDWRRPSAATIVDRVMRTMHPGDIVLMHDGGGDRHNTVAALPIIIRQLKAQGYRFVTMPELLQLRAQASRSANTRATAKPQPTAAATQPASPGPGAIDPTVNAPMNAPNSTMDLPL
ncbi:polysaccharide deacetylase family protein [Limnothrix sp. FACHB-881]|uniref:polysaccharide deacetylase family protein n=1 Tax=Limnothrix sp. FACHB-881 TaxID=2692819 RepID=UPI0016859A5B|nr:polysaccharide deacetylase family protein [Limnothrix sp. FACHB-881]MBD2636418.1 polysaccharide deacetylase family protein [Limnothrix sp. FACHB-881]